MLSSFFFSKSPMVKLIGYHSIVFVLIYLTTNTSCFMILRSSMYQQVTCLIIVSKKLISGIETLFQKHAFIFKMGFETCFHFQNVKSFVFVVFPFSGKHNCKQKSVLSLQIALLKRLWTNNEIYINICVVD